MEGGDIYMTRKPYINPAIIEFGSAVVSTLGSPGITVEALSKQPR
jgi:hypothetical protein